MRPRTKIIFTLHNNHQPGWCKRILLFLTRFFRNDDIIFPGTTPKWYQKKNAVVIPNGIDMSVYHEGERSSTFTFLFIGRLTEQKNPLFLADLANALKKNYRFIIRVAGDGPLLEPLKKKIADSGLSGYFDILGYRNDIPLLLSTAHCLLMPSKWEGMPLTLLEAAACGLPVIASNTGNNSTLLNSSNASIGNLDEFESMLADVMDNYGDAVIRARRLKATVRSGYSILNCYNLHLPLWLHKENK